MSDRRGTNNQFSYRNMFTSLNTNEISYWRQVARGDMHTVKFIELIQSFGDRLGGIFMLNFLEDNDSTQSVKDGVSFQRCEAE
jgi:hypothetical protein